MLPIILTATFILGPIAEIYVLLTAGSAFGVLPVIGAILTTAIIGGAIIRHQGLAALNKAQKDLGEGRAPVGAALDGAMLLVAAPLLITPGFLTDFLGFCLLTPPIRRFIAVKAYEALKKRFEKGDATITIIRP